MTGTYSRRAPFIIVPAAIAVLAVVLVLGISDGSSADSGTCGDSLNWEFATDTLTVTGTGAMAEWSSAEEVPWNSHRAEIEHVSLPDGLTTIGNYAFSQCQMTEFVIPDNVTTMGTDCLNGCDKLTDLTIGAKVDNFSAAMMRGSTEVKNVQLTGANYYAYEYYDVVFSPDQKTLIYCPPKGTYYEYHIPDATERIRSYAFMDCATLLIKFDGHPTVFEDRAFYNANVNQSSFPFGADTEYIGSELWGDNHPAAVYFHLDFKGTLKSDFTQAEFCNADGSACSKTRADLNGKQFDWFEGYTVAYAVLSIRYQLADGTEVAPRVYELMGEGLQYSYGSPGVGGYTPNITNVSGTSDRTVRDVIVVYSNEQHDVVYYYNGDEVMRSTEYYGYTVEVKAYGDKVPANKWYTVSVDVTDGKFVMPDNDVYFSNVPIGPDGIEHVEDREELTPVAIGLAVAVAVIAVGLLFTMRRH